MMVAFGTSGTESEDWGMQKEVSPREMADVFGAESKEF